MKSKKGCGMKECPSDMKPQQHMKRTEAGMMKKGGKDFPKHPKGMDEVMQREDRNTTPKPGGAVK